MVNNRSLIIVGGLAAVAWLASNSLYVVDETERAVKLRFGEVIEENIQPGLHFKVPITQTVRKFDTRVLTLDTDTSRYLTLEQKAVIVDSYVKWQVVNPTRYYEATAGDETMAIRLIQPRVDESLRNEFGRLDLQQIIAERRDDLMIRPTQELDSLMREELGVSILDVRVKRIDLPDDVSTAVFDRMRSEREREAREWRAQGQEESERIRANADRRRQVLLAQATERAETLRGEGDAEAAAIFSEAYGQNPEFFTFWRSLNAYRASFDGERDMLVLDPTSDFFRYLRSPEVQNGE
ncbi:protease modulator HflC [Halomonas sp. MCCC 1A17488]|uniref:Protein HflC n=1 Tax=Billgrantia sulfidoxydans TaxID=2733484 RepID=A0ABX7W9V6_9GAMM|nr:MULTISPECIES: protease modulator HflC [Halomonas]MCE8018231.1 protease modulator HflC [Halomonas sp. MCCC 1A17488]MCG3241564.1 protease modulator HflC [Halomonas sp. MCCC 1A17488]QPP48486.1 protease modulator HflC [Halomonas sp. SS10-MC5]QTP55798.1 protease modulator HflC [Halomonas sulfidoxydans]